MDEFSSAIKDITNMPPNYAHTIINITPIIDKEAILKFLAYRAFVKALHGDDPCIKLGFINNIVCQENSLFGKNAYIFGESLESSNYNSIHKGDKDVVREVLLCAVVVNTCIDFDNDKLEQLDEDFPGFNKSRSARAFTKRGYEFSAYEVNQILPLFNVYYKIGDIRAEMKESVRVPKLKTILHILPALARFFEDLKATTIDPEKIKTVNSLIRKIIVDFTISAKEFIDEVSIVLNLRNKVIPFMVSYENLQILVDSQMASNNSRNDVNGNYSYRNYSINIIKMKDEIIEARDGAADSDILFVERLFTCMIVGAEYTEVLAEVIKV